MADTRRRDMRRRPGARLPLVFRWVTVAACVVQGAYMAFDGIRALVVGTYLTPDVGDHVGQLGPWARVVTAVGIPAGIDGDEGRLRRPRAAAHAPLGRG